MRPTSKNTTIRYDLVIGRWNAIDPMAERYSAWSPYNYTVDNQLRYIDPSGTDTIDIVKNEGKWDISNIQIVEGDDVFRVTNGDEINTYTFSEGEYGKRVNILNIENNDDYTLLEYHISGASEGGTGFAVTPGGDPSTEVNLNKRLPPDVYTLGQGYGKWKQPWVLSGENVGDVSMRGIKFHFGYRTPIKWTEGCFVISSDYSMVDGQIIYDKEESRQALIDFDTNLGADSIYEYKIEGKKYTFIGAKFSKPIKFKLIIKDGY